METMLETASQFGNVYGIVGGLHATRPEALQGLGLICATHCTQQKAKIRSLYPEAYIEGGAGRVINIP
jgi:7,8-dihydropterin-6-yl-methyl-4-(beta-D-ribofuranosyl)aminobenzene 5'-phosphate synthase